MKLCIPIQENNGIESQVYSHFGSATAFMIYDSETSKYQIIDNSDQNHTHGACNPINSINGQNINVVLVGGIGARAIEKLNARNIKVFQTVKETAKENIELFKNSQLQEMTIQEACAHHNHGGGCHN